ncbi:MAG: cell division FtsA domain-containing protein, partial [Verrucomicrobiota bacterium]
LNGDNGLELPLERLANGQLTNACRETLTHRLRDFLKQHGAWLRPRALCAISARGVSLRRLALPAASKEELQRLLVLQIENEFPLPPNDLAWGYLQSGPEKRLRNEAAPGQELIVVAVKKETIEEYSEILIGCGLSPIFTLGGLARSALCPAQPGSYAILDIGRSHSELISFENGAAASIRILPWGGENMTQAIEKRLEISHDEAEKMKFNLEQAPDSNEEWRPKIQAGIQEELELLAGLINRNWTGKKLYLTGKSSWLKDIATALAKALGAGVECERMEPRPGEGRSAATLGLERYSEKNGGRLPLILDLKTRKDRPSVAPPILWKWAAWACLFAAALLFLPYGEAILLKPQLLKKLATLKAYRESLPKIDRELSFLHYLQTNQAPCLDALFIVANSAAPGTRFDAVSMNRRGDLSLRGMMQTMQAAEFRSKLIDSGFFSSVVLEEQTPTPDRQRVVIRITAQWKQPGARPSLPASSSAVKELKSETPARELKTSKLENREAPAPGEKSKK